MIEPGEGNSKEDSTDPKTVIDTCKRRVKRMPARCVVNLDDITTLPKVLIKERITDLPREIDAAIRVALDLDPSIEAFSYKRVLNT